MGKRTKLILVEGLCGTGKTTLAGRLHRFFEHQEMPSRYYDEGATEHPTSLNGYAFYREEAYARLLERYPNEAEDIQARAVGDGLNHLIPYRWIEANRKLDLLHAELKSRELCWTDAPVASLSEFTYSVQQQWGRFVEHSGGSDTIYILEAVFMQHQIHDLLRLYQADEDVIERHIAGIAEQIAAMNPIMIYLSQPSVREQQEWISSVRGKPHNAEEPNIRFMENRKRLELALLGKLPFPAYIMDNPNRDWEAVYRQSIEAISRHISTTLKESAEHGK